MPSRSLQAFPVRRLLEGLVEQARNHVVDDPLPGRVDLPQERLRRWQEMSLALLVLHDQDVVRPGLPDLPNRPQELTGRSFGPVDPAAHQLVPAVLAGLEGFEISDFSNHLPTAQRFRAVAIVDSFQLDPKLPASSLPDPANAVAPQVRVIGPAAEIHGRHAGETLGPISEVPDAEFASQPVGPEDDAQCDTTAGRGWNLRQSTISRR